MSEEVWKIISPHLPGQAGSWGGIAKDNRTFINAVCWILRTGAPWRDLPPDYGKWSTVWKRFNRWSKAGVWDRIREKMLVEPDFEWLMIDASHVKVHQHATGAMGGNQDMGRTKGGSTQKFTLQWILMVCQSTSKSQQAQPTTALKQSTWLKESAQKIYSEIKRTVQTKWLNMRRNITLLSWFRQNQIEKNSGIMTSIFTNCGI